MVDDLTAVRVGRAVAQHVLQRRSRLRGKPYRSGDCEDDRLALWNSIGQCGFEPAYESQRHLVEPEAKLRGFEPRVDLALDRVGVDHKGFCNHGRCPSKSGPPEGDLQSPSFAGWPL